MNGNQQDPEPLLDDVDYQQILRGDSLLTRIGPSNFASLIEAPAPYNAENRESRHQELHQLEQQPPQDQQAVSNMQFNVLPMNNALMINNDNLTLADCGMGLIDSWGNLEGPLVENVTDPLLLNPTQWQEPSPVVVPQPQAQPQAPAGARDGSASTSFIPDSTPNSQVPSIQIWPGQYDFQISVPVGNKDRNKWCYNAIQKKLYLIKHVTVPVDVKLLQWLDAYITITPVFKASRNRVHHVMPCFNCSSKTSVASSEHIVMVEGQDCEYTYKYADKRPVVTLPLHPPPPGEAASTLLLKLVCLTSCNGGPNRRPFSLVFTLHNNSTGSEIGRQVLDLKCCQCPSRDMLNEDKAVQHLTQSTSTDISNRLMERSGPAVTSTGEKKKRLTIKLEPGTDRRYSNVPVPVEHVPKVKGYVNSLIAAEYMRRNQSCLFLFSEDESQ